MPSFVELDHLGPGDSQQSTGRKVEVKAEIIGFFIQWFAKKIAGDVSLQGWHCRGVLLDFLEKQLPFGPGSARLMCQAASVPTALRPDNIDTLLKYCACHAKHERCIYIYIHACNNKQKHAKKRGNPPPSRHPDHNFVSAL